MSGSVFSQTLQTITTTKLEELAQQRIAFDKDYAALIVAAKAEQDPLKRLISLADATKSCLGIKTSNCKSKDGRPGRIITGGTRNSRLETDLKNLDRFVEQAKFDPSVSVKVLENWEKTLFQYLSIQASKFQYADLYGKLVTEWLSSEKPSQSDGDVEMKESFEELPGAKKLAARSQWERSVFEPAVVDVDALKAYLQQLFITDKKAAASVIEELRNKVEDFENDLASPGQFNASDLLPNEKREVLKDFLSNDVILIEVGDVLSMRLSALDRWTWGDHVPLEQRRKLNGSYSIHMHEDVLQAIFLHYIGVKWSVFFRNAFLSIRNDNAWKGSKTDVTKKDIVRRQYFMGPTWTSTHKTLEGTRDATQKNRYFVHQLLDFETQAVEVNEGEEEAEYGDHVNYPPDAKRQKRTVQRSLQSARKQTANYMNLTQSTRAELAAAGLSGRLQQPAEPDDSDDGDTGFGLFDDNSTPPPRGPKKPIEAKQDLLHLLSTEIILNTRLHGELSCFRTVFESWNPLLPHQTVRQVLEFFGVSDKWRSFFTKFLEAPLKFMDDGPTAETRLRRRGAPGSHTLSEVLGECVLFCLDFSINQATDGALSHRLYDDIWFWNRDYDKWRQASASHTSKTLTIDERLPEDQIRWGFLYLDPSTGRFEIDQKMVDSHVEELRTQLQGKSKSVIDWIQTWNSYAATLLQLQSLASTSQLLWPRARGQNARHAPPYPGICLLCISKHMISSRFDVHDIPDGFLFFPVELGGLDLKSPFVNLLQLRDSVRENPHDLLDEFLEKEADDYVALKSLFDKGRVKHEVDREDMSLLPTDTETFISQSEFARWREAFASTGQANIRDTFAELLHRPAEQHVDISVQVSQAISQLQGQGNLRGITARWSGMDAYWKWIAQMYGGEMVERFGGLNVVDPGLLPIGMVGFFRARRTKWQG
ncbi:hypothetical protein SNOG_07083 [Parastagonospora nodorum SN15]|uniref:Reverse transcriptase domain-containing protein n=1 Tax=Phaeosphaeria nodorum (strain SN15 / ATCC MYA-4574 / FGSC 10173) TaxID=321614 RepID=Q0UMD1_PHANO|nr:hypothetical protein SNOG_07083 [Parastagonospora nodorum SN15]EAT85734.2 hypothetical protein SNOG_07083 [Parastagonospora nodorum SN15]